MLGVLPTETILSIFCFLPLRQLNRLSSISKLWKSFVETNECNIYHAAAVLHEFVRSDLKFEEAKLLYAWLDGVDSWKKLCYRFYCMDIKWEGYKQPNAFCFGLSNSFVWRFKVDQEQRTVITTHFDGGLRVSVAGEKEVLWSLPPSEVHPYAHCEFTNGYLIFTRRGDAVDVWRRKRDMGYETPISHLYCDGVQKRASRMIYQSERSVAMDDRGAFIPWTTIMPPNSVRALRAVDSTLLLASLISQEAYLYDLPTGNLKQTVQFPGKTNSQLDVNYVELSSRHIFVCSVEDVLVIPLHAEHSQTVFNFPSQIQNFQDFCDEHAYRIEYDEDGSPLYTREPEGDDVLIECVCEQRVKEISDDFDSRRNFTAVHVSPCGKHFVTTDEQGYLCIVRDFESALRNHTPLQEYVTVIDMKYPVMNLSFEDDKRIIAYVDRRGVFILPFVTNEETSIDTYTMEPVRRLRVLHAKLCDSVEVVQFCSCLQMNRSQVWYSWSEMHAQPGLISA